MHRAMWRSLLATAVTAVVLTTTITPAAATISYYDSDDGGRYTVSTLLNRHAAKAIAIQDASTANLAPAIQWPWVKVGVENDVMVMYWETTDTGAFIKPLHRNTPGRTSANDMCLAVYGASEANGAAIVQAYCTNDSVVNDRWYYESLGSGWYQIRNRKSGKCIAVEDASTADGARLVQWTCNGTANSQWTDLDYKDF